METTTLTIHVSKNVESLLEHKARQDGKDISEYVENLIERDLDPRKVLDEILVPVREQFAKSGLTEDDLDVLIERERQAIWEERHNKA